MRQTRPRKRGSGAALVSCVFAALACGTVVIAPGATESAVANGDTRTISLYHAHTHESISATFLVDGQYDSAVLEKLNWFLRDWRRDEPTKMDPRLFDVIWEVYREAGSGQPIEVMSAYRSPETNAMLRRRSRGVAEHSQHILGKAMDQHYVDVPMSRIREIAMKLQHGGVGFYPTAGTPFVHMDVGGVRHWPRMSYDQLARLFPDGKTVHIPSNGQPLSGYEQARAELEARGDSFSYPTATEVKSKGFFAWLFGGGDEEDDSASAHETRSRRGQTRVASLDRGTSSVSSSAAYGNQGKDAGVRAFNLAPSASSGSAVQAPERRTPVVQAAIDPARDQPSEAQAQQALARAMTDARQKPASEDARNSTAASVGVQSTAAHPEAPGLASAQTAAATQAFAVANATLAPSAPMPPLRPVELAAQGPSAPLPPDRPTDFAPSRAAKSDRAPGVNAPKKDAIGNLIAATTPARTANLPMAISQGPDAAKLAGAPQVFAYAGSVMPTPPARVYAPLPLARPSQFVAARLDRSNFRSLTGSGTTARAAVHSGLGSAVAALRPAAQASLGAMAGQASPVVRRFGTYATDLTSDHFSGSTVKPRELVVTSTSSGG